jgi:hypothetical protein
VEQHVVRVMGLKVVAIARDAKADSPPVNGLAGRPPKTAIRAVP